MHIIKSLGLSTLLYGSEMITIDKKYVDLVMDIIWEFVWEGKKCYVSRDICKLPRDMGGIGMPDFHTIIKVKRVKMVVSILKAEPEDLWSSMPKSYFKCLDVKYDLPYFALRVDEASSEIKFNKNVPDYYK
jgi:hypothetical protein